GNCPGSTTIDQAVQASASNVRTSRVATPVLICSFRPPGGGRRAGPGRRCALPGALLYAGLPVVTTREDSRCPPRNGPPSSASIQSYTRAISVVLRTGGGGNDGSTGTVSPAGGGARVHGRTVCRSRAVGRNRCLGAVHRPRRRPAN